MPVWHDNDRKLQVANSGLPGPLRISNGRVEEIPVAGIPLGLFASAEYEERSLRCKPGDVFLFLTDGITDATSSKGNMFGRGRLEKVAIKNAHRSADEIAQAIFGAVNDHAKGVEAFDDLTIVVLKVKGTAGPKVSDSRPQERPPAFTYARSTGRGKASRRELLADQLPLRQLAERYGTPLYVYSATAIRQRYRQFDEAFSNCEHTICYSVKANSNLSILRLLASLGAGFDIVSGGELQRVLQASRKSVRKIVFSGVGKLLTSSTSR